MGCVVNGPGEAKDADIGIASGKRQCRIVSNGDSWLESFLPIRAVEGSCRSCEELAGELRQLIRAFPLY